MYSVSGGDLLLLYRTRFCILDMHDQSANRLKNNNTKRHTETAPLLTSTDKRCSTTWVGGRTTGKEGKRGREGFNHWSRSLALVRTTEGSNRAMLMICAAVAGDNDCTHHACSPGFELRGGPTEFDPIVDVNEVLQLHLSGYHNKLLIRHLL